MLHAGVAGVIAWRSGGINAYAFGSLDAKEYYHLAGNLVERGAFSQSEVPPHEPDTWRTPGYPLFLATLMKLLGPSPTVLIVAQQLLAVFNVWLLYAIVRTHLGTDRAALTALLFMLEPYHIFYSFWLLATTWFTTFILLTWWAWQRLLNKPTAPNAAVTGLAAGALVLIRPIAILVPVILMVGYAARRLCHPRHYDNRLRPTALRLPVLALMIAGALLPVAWMARNQLVAGHFALSHQSGIVLAYFKATEVILWREGRTADRYLETSLDPNRRDEPHEVWSRIDERLRARLQSHHPDLDEEVLDQVQWANIAQGNRTPIDSFVLSSTLGSIAREELLTSPWSTFSCSVARCLVNLTFPLSSAIRPPRGVEVNRMQSLVLGLGFTFLFAAALAGLIRSRGAFELTFYPVAVSVALLIATTPQVDPRFRVPLIPLLVFLALIAVLRWKQPGRCN